MVYTYDIDNKTRFIVIYQDVTKKLSKINRLTGIALSTLQDWSDKLQRDEDIYAIKPGRGRKPKVTQDLIENLVEETQDSFTSTRKLASQFGIGKTTITDILHDKGFKYSGVKTGHAFTKKEKENRVTYCTNMLKRKGAMLEDTFFTDEMGIQLSHAYPKKAWAPPNKKVKVELPQQDVRLNCWAGISANGATSLHIFKGSLNHERYEAILEEAKEEMDELYPDGFHLQHDNSRVHQASEPWARDQGFDIINFPTYSPDLSPIENVWSTLKNAVFAENPKTEDELKDSLFKNWDKLTDAESLEPYFKSLVTRYKECIQQKGDKLPY